MADTRCHCFSLPQNTNVPFLSRPLPLLVSWHLHDPNPSSRDDRRRAYPTYLSLGEERGQHEAEHDERPAVQHVDDEDVRVVGVGEHVAQHHDDDADAAHDDTRRRRTRRTRRTCRTPRESEAGCHAAEAGAYGQRGEAIRLASGCQAPAYDERRQQDGVIQNI